MASGKRNASSDLNHNNWDKDDVPEDAGSFSKASQDILKNRVIKIAKRRNPIGSLPTGTPAAEPDKTGVFANFGGFTKMPTSTMASFNFLGNVTSSAEQPKTNGFGLTNVTTTTSASNSRNDNRKEYYAKIKGLNQSVSNWIKKHVDTNPFLNLSPIFRDYEKYFEEIEHLNSDLVTTATIESNATVTNSLKFADTNKSSIFTNVKTTEATSFSFGKMNTATTNSIAGFNFVTDSSKPIQSNTVENKDEAESDEPPKVDFTPVVEDGYIFTIKCKVFVKKADTYGDKGIGTLYLKPVPNSDKVQLIVRADTNLGLLLCNFILSSNIPIKRMGNKDVMLVCVPLPESKPPPVPVLLRVKSPEEADGLSNALEKHKK